MKIIKRFQIKMLTWIKKIQTYTDKGWYPWLIAFLAALDNLVVIIPNDGILISSSMLSPKRWFNFSLWMAIGSTFGAMILASIVKFYGLPLILEFFPTFTQTDAWNLSQEFFQQYGLLMVLIVAITPLTQHPAVILASMANVSFYHLAVVIFIGRFVKFLVMAYIGSHTPHLIKKIWGVRSELDEVGLKVD